MKLLFTFILLLFYTIAFGQVSTDEKPMTNEQKEIFKEKFSKEKLLVEVTANSCKCIDSISVQNKNAKETAVEVKRCIDNVVMAYQSGTKLGELLNQLDSTAVGESLNINIENNPDSQEYKKYYYEIERELMENCPSIKNVTAMNNKENEKSLSNNASAIEEYNKGNAFIRENNYAKALPFYKRAVLFDPEFVFAWDNIGFCSRRTGDFDQALKAYKMSLKLDPKSMMALQNIPLVYVSKKQYKKAIDSYNELAKVDSENPEIYYGIGLIYFQNLKDNEKALDNMCKAYNLYISHNSPYRTDAEKLIQALYDDFKTKGEVEKFNAILEANNISH